MTRPNLDNYGEMGAAIKDVLIPADILQARVAELGRQISLDYAGRSPLLVGVLKGVVIFIADLLRSVTIPVDVDFLAVANYAGGGGGVVRLEKDLSSPITGRHVLFVEDVVDTGLTLNYLLNNLRARQPASLEVCTMFNKPAHRLVNVQLKYMGFDLPDRFVVGYGLDYQEKYRNLPFVGLLSSHILKKPKKGTDGLI